ncbi:MAG: transporter related [Frankiales bacterium]|nr:transporter related [Frankiales bacterium]
MLLLDDVVSGYGATTVLRGVTLAVPDGSVVALLGPNGAGKTTLLRTASGLLRPTAGRLLLDGVDLTRSSPHELQANGVCHVPEGRGVFRSMTVRDNLRLMALPGEESDAVDRAASAFPKLGQRVTQLAGTMSGGEQQMLALSRAYLQRPAVVLLDEVSMGLAPNIVDEIFDFLAALAAQGSSLLLVEQYVTRALAVADYVYVLDRGEVSFAGEPSELASDELFARYAGLEEAPA